MGDERHEEGHGAAPPNSAPGDGAPPVGREEGLGAGRASTRPSTADRSSSAAPERRNDSIADLLSKWRGSVTKRTSGPKQRWRDAYSTVIAYQLPPYVLEGRHSIRPQADEVRHLPY